MTTENAAAPPPPLRELVKRYNHEVFELGRPRARIRLDGAASRPFDVLLDGKTATLVAGDRDQRADATLRADPRTWQSIAEDLRGGMDAFRRGRLQVRYDLHLGIGFLAATADAQEGGLRLRTVRTARGRISISEAGAGPAVVMIHGLGATKVSFLPTLAALAPHCRAIAVDLPGFGDSDKPIVVPYNAPYFADTMTALLDALELDRADFV